MTGHQVILFKIGSDQTWNNIASVIFLFDKSLRRQLYRKVRDKMLNAVSTVILNTLIFEQPFLYKEIRRIKGNTGGNVDVLSLVQNLMIWPEPEFWQWITGGVSDFLAIQ